MLRRNAIKFSLGVVARRNRQRLLLTVFSFFLSISFTLHRILWADITKSISPRLRLTGLGKNCVCIAKPSILTFLIAFYTSGIVSRSLRFTIHADTYFLLSKSHVITFSLNIRHCWYSHWLVEYEITS